MDEVYQGCLCNLLNLFVSYKEIELMNNVVMMLVYGLVKNMEYDVVVIIYFWIFKRN